jgi:hypothetical protein
MKASQPSTIGRYQVRDRIGHGGMGVVYLAVDPLLERLVAVKLLRTDSDEMHERFVREARLAGRLQHTNIVTIFDVGEHEGQPFIAMEYVAGETLAEKIRRRIPLPVARKVHLIADLCDGLAYAHKAGVVHRDIKPSNIILSRTGVLKILDFGIARAAESGLTQTGVMVGTPSYMSPEQVEGRPVDHRSDMFATGLLLYEILTLRQAFPDDAPHLIANRILTAFPEPLLQLMPDLDPVLVQVVERAIQKAPGARYPDMSAMRHELLQIAQRLDSAARDGTLVQEVPQPSTAQNESKRQHVSARESSAERPAAQITAHVDAAGQALRDGRYEAAVEAAERALALAPADHRAHELIDRARAAIDERQLQEWVEGAREAINRGELTDAFRLVAQALKLNPRSSDALSVRRELEALERERERVAERTRAIEAALADARNSMRQGAYESALRSAAEALVHDASHAEAQAIHHEATAALEALREQEDRARRATEAIRSASERFKAGEWEDAIQDLEQFDPANTLVSREVLELRRQVDLIKRREQEERVRRQREEDARKEQDERIRRETWAAAQLGAARHAIGAAQFERALTILRQVEQASPAAIGLAELQTQAKAGLEAVQAEAQRRERIDESIRQATRYLAEGDFDLAAKHADSQLTPDPHDKRRLTELRIEIRRARFAAEQRLRQEDVDRRAHLAVTDAQRDFAEGRYDEALARLSTFAPPHPAVSDALVTLRAEAEGIQRELAETELHLRAPSVDEAPMDWPAVEDAGGSVVLASESPGALSVDRPASRRGLRSWATIGLSVSAAAALVFLAISWMRPPPAAKVPSPTPPTTAIVPSALERAREQWSRSNRQGTLAIVESALVSDPNDSGLRRFLDEIANDARTRAERAETDARQVRAQQLAAGRYQEAAAKFKEAEPLIKAQRPSGVSMLWEAEALFSAAAAEARSAKVIEPADQKLMATLNRARDRAERARADAVSARAPELRQSDFARADAKAMEATQHQRAARNEQAVRAFLEAEGLFAAATRAAASAKMPPLEEATPPPATTKVETPPVSLPPTKPAPARVDTPAPSTSPGGTTAADTARIDRLLARYADAYRRLDFDALREIFPTAGVERRRGIDQNRKACRAYDVNITSRQISTITSGSVMLTLKAVHTCTPRTAQKEQASLLEEVFVLQRDQTDNWIISKTGLMDR